MSLAGLGDSRNALLLVSAAKVEWQRIGAALHIVFWEDLLDRYLGQARASIDAVQADAIWEEGTRIGFDDAAGRALRAAPPGG